MGALRPPARVTNKRATKSIPGAGLDFKLVSPGCSRTKGRKSRRHTHDGRTFANDNERVAHLFNLYAEAVKAEKETK